jgi:dihydroorotate dehydrogenase
MFSLIRPFIFNLDPEKAHDLAIKSLKYNFLPSNLFSVNEEEMLSTQLFGKEISNPIGLAAGFDKSAEVYNEIFKIGFGFVEVGTVTPKQQLGNEKPRVFRLEKDQALINRLGFNNDGSEIVKRRIESNIPSSLLGINIGPNKDTDDMTEDFIRCAEIFFPIGDYITINISSPNTTGLRNFHREEILKKLFFKINEIRKKSNFKKFFLLKVSPDLENSNIPGIINIILENKIDGVILTNTTDKNRENLQAKNSNEKGGLSGKPIKDISTQFVRRFYKDLKGKVPIIGVGGVDSGESAFEKIAAGASAVQLYTGLIYKGPTIVKEIKKDLIKILKNKGFKSVNEAIGSDLN